MNSKADGCRRSTSAESALSTLSNLDNAEVTIRPCLSRSSMSRSSSHGSRSADSRKLLKCVSFADLSVRENDALRRSREGQDDNDEDEDDEEDGTDSVDSCSRSARGRSADLQIRIPSSRESGRRRACGGDDPRVERLSRKLSQAFQWPTSDRREGKSNTRKGREADGKGSLTRFFRKLFARGAWRRERTGRARSGSAEVSVSA